MAIFQKAHRITLVGKSVNVNFSIVIIVVLSAFVTGFFSMKIRGKLITALSQKTIRHYSIGDQCLYVTYPCYKIKKWQRKTPSAISIIFLLFSLHPIGYPFQLKKDL